MATSTPVVTQNDHMAAAAYLMKHIGATALVVLDGPRPGRPVGIITKAGIAQAAAAGGDLDDIRIRDLMSSAGSWPSAGPVRGPASSTGATRSTQIAGGADDHPGRP